MPSTLTETATVFGPNSRPGVGTNFWGPAACPPNTHAVKIRWREHDYVNALDMQCSDGSFTPNWNYFDSSDGWPRTDPVNLTKRDGWDKITYTSLAGLYTINDFPRTDHPFSDGWLPETTTYKCPEGQKVVGFIAGARNRLYSAGVICDYTPEYCESKLESKYCKNNKSLITPEVLNIACAANMTDTCRNRKSELHPTIVREFCKKNPEDELCSCFRPVPKYINPNIAGLQQCWNQDCLNYGYRANNDVCPAITICSQALDASGSSNKLTGSVQTVNCNNTAPVVAVIPSSADIPSSSPGVSPGVSPSLVPSHNFLYSATYGIKNYYILIFLAIIFLAIILFLITKRKKTPKK